MQSGNRKFFMTVISEILAAMFVLSLASCAGGSSDTVSMYDLQSAMLAADKDLPEMSSASSSSEDAANLFTYISDLDYNKVDSYFLAYSSSGTSEEIAVIALKNSSDAPEAEKSLKAHMEKRRKLFENYAPEQVDDVKNGLLFTDGRYVVLIISKNQSEVKAAFQKFIQ